MIDVRAARPDDAASACDILRRSIRELCADDHRGDPATLDAWLLNKTLANVERWIRENHVVVADEAGALRGVGAIRSTGEITLNYVAPEARWRGVSKALIATLESWARGQGLDVVTLHSTVTARRFYASAGYVDSGPPKASWGDMLGYPMRKSLRLPSVVMDPS